LVASVKDRDKSPLLSQRSVGSCPESPRAPIAGRCTQDNSGEQVIELAKLSPVSHGAAEKERRSFLECVRSGIKRPVDDSANEPTEVVPLNVRERLSRPHRPSLYVSQEPSQLVAAQGNCCIGRNSHSKDWHGRRPARLRPIIRWPSCAGQVVRTPLVRIDAQLELGEALVNQTIDASRDLRLRVGEDKIVRVASIKPTGDAIELVIELVEVKIEECA
jgi:hypothetical protein